MCYFVSIGARAPAHLLVQVFDEWAELDVAIASVRTPVASAFPVDDEVCLVTRRGCSCDLVAPGKRATELVAAFQRSVVELARRFGSLRMLVHRDREPSPSRVPGPPLSLSVRQFMGHDGRYVEDVVMEISANEPHGHRVG